MARRRRGRSRNPAGRFPRWLIRKLGLPFALSLLVAGWLVGQFTPVVAVVQVARLSHPATLNSLPKRGANQHLNQVVFWLDDGRRRNGNPTNLIRWSQRLNGTRPPRAPLVEAALLRNLRIADGLEVWSRPESRPALRRGASALVGRGPYRGERTEVDHIVPVSVAPEAGSELANLELMPATLNRRKSDRVGSRQLAHARKLYEAGLIAEGTLRAVESHAQRRPLNFTEPELTSPQPSE